MRITRGHKIATVAFAGVLALSACSESDEPTTDGGTADIDCASGSLSGEGSSFQKNAITEWIKLVAGKDANIRTSGRDCRGTVEVAEAAYLAADERRVVSLPIEPRPWVESGSAVDTGKTSDARYHIDI